MLQMLPLLGWGAAALPAMRVLRRGRPARPLWWRPLLRGPLPCSLQLRLLLLKQLPGSVVLSRWHCSAF